MRALLAGQLALLLALVVWIAGWPPRSRAGLAAQAAGSLLGVLALARVGLWLYPPWWSPYAAAVVIGVAFAWHASRGARHDRWPTVVTGWLSMALFVAIGAASGALLLYLRTATRPPGDVDAVALAPPLAAGRYLVVNGGGALLINAHRASMDTTNVRLRAWRGNGHAVDLVAIDDVGRRADGLLPRDPARYRIFGVAVLAPCAGTIVQVTDGLPDQSPPDADRSHPAGNHIVLDCDGTHVALAHLRQGSVRVARGDRVATGAVLGAVGNSGGTDEPHLHVHAQRPGPPGEPMAGDPLPILMRDRYLARGDRVVWP